MCRPRRDRSRPDHRPASGRSGETGPAVVDDGPAGGPRRGRTHQREYPERELVGPADASRRLRTTARPVYWGRFRRQTAPFSPERTRSGATASTRTSGEFDGPGLDQQPFVAGVNPAPAAVRPVAANTLVTVTPAPFRERNERQRLAPVWSSRPPWRRPERGPFPECRLLTSSQPSHPRCSPAVDLARRGCDGHPCRPHPAPDSANAGAIRLPLPDPPPETKADRPAIPRALVSFHIFR